MSEPKVTVKVSKADGGAGVSAIKAQPGVYATVCNIVFTPEECILHFGQGDPEHPEEVHSVAKVLLSVQHAKRIAEVIRGSVARYEATFGAIETNPIARLLPNVRETVQTDIEEQVKQLEPADATPE